MAKKKKNLPDGDGAPSSSDEELLNDADAEDAGEAVAELSSPSQEAPKLKPEDVPGKYKKFL